MQKQKGVIQMSAKNMALGGVLTALTLVILYLTLLIPTNTLTLLTLASFMVPVALMKGSIKTSIMVYVSSSILSLLLLPFNIALLYIVFFGCYGIIKYFIERLDHLPLEWLLKLIFFNIIFFISLQVILTFIDPKTFSGLEILISKYLPGVPYANWIVLWFLGQCAFGIFDYALTLLIDFYYTHFSKIQN